MTTDINTLLARVDLSKLVTTPLHGNERERYGPCPKCGGEDRFHIRHYQGRDYFFCRKCHEKRGDAIEFMCWMHGHTFAEAVRELGGEVSNFARNKTTLTTTSPTEQQPFKNVNICDIAPPTEQQPVQLPPAQWRNRAGLFVERCAAYLWTSAGQPAREYLHRRGLTDETINQYRLGLNPKFAKGDGEEWGLERDVTRAMGITIPRFALGELWAVNIRRLNNDMTPYVGNNKYLMVTGGAVTALFNCDAISTDTAAIIATGGELDAILCQQFAPNGIACISLGAEGYTLKPPFRSCVENVPYVRVAYDADDAGAAGAFKWIDLKTRVRRAKTPAGKDGTKNHQQGGDLGAWVSEITGIQPIDTLEYWTKHITSKTPDIVGGGEATIPKSQLSAGDAAQLAMVLPSALEMVLTHESMWIIRARRAFL